MEKKHILYLSIYYLKLKKGFTKKNKIKSYGNPKS